MKCSVSGEVGKCSFDVLIMWSRNLYFQKVWVVWGELCLCVKLVSDFRPDLQKCWEMHLWKTSHLTLLKISVRVQIQTQLQISGVIKSLVVWFSSLTIIVMTYEVGICFQISRKHVTVLIWHILGSSAHLNYWLDWKAWIKITYYFYRKRHWQATAAYIHEQLPTSKMFSNSLTRQSEGLLMTI